MNELTNQISTVFLTGIIIVLAVLLIVVLIRAIIGPDIADRLMSINMIGTLTIMIICVLSVMLKEVYIGDVPLIYASISFVAVVVLGKIYIGVYKDRIDKK